MTLPLWPLAFAVVGLVVYLATDKKLQEVGRLLLLAGLVALAFALAGKTIHIG